jgi:cytochrome b
MVLALLLSLFVVSFSGLKLYAVEEGLGPLAGPLPSIALVSPAYADDDGDDEDEEDGESEGEEFWEEIHEASANFTLFLVFLHIAGVIVSSRLHGENLVKAMFTGRKSS